MPKSPFPALNEFITLLEKRLDGGEDTLSRHLPELDRLG